MFKDNCKRAEKEYKCPTTSLKEFDIFEYTQMQSDPTWIDTMKKRDIEKINSLLPQHLETCQPCKNIYNEITTVENALRNFSKFAKFLYITE